jgi:nucleoside-diphosphate-sugar epimerase
MSVLITGANGFIGGALCQYLLNQGVEVIPVVRRRCDIPNAKILSEDDEAGWRQTLLTCDTMVHLAGQSQVDLAHPDPFSSLHHSNVALTVSLFRRAAAADVRRFIYVSSAKVNGERTETKQFVSADDPVAPEDHYALSKWKAEQSLRSEALGSRTELVVIRPPLVYGPAVKGNFNALIRLLKRQLPLPMACINNQRSLLALENLCSFIALCADRDRSPLAADQTFLVADGPPVSTPELFRQIATAYELKVRLFCVPPKLMRWLLLLVGKSSISNRLFDSFVVDDKKCNELLGWVPPVTMAQQLKRMHIAEVS